jgi:predicted nucleotide-binding protein
MGTKKTADLPRNPDALIVKKESFKDKLNERIEIGKKILNQPITNEIQYEELKTDFYKWDNYNSEYLKHAFNNNKDSEYKVTYDDVNCYNYTYSRNTLQEKHQALQKDIRNKINNLETLVNKIDLLKSEVPEQLTIRNSVSLSENNNDIFIVHGHNTGLIDSIARVIKNLDLNPIILYEQPNNGDTIIEKFEKHSEVGFAIIIMTGDDEGKAKTETDLKNRARQNVILELGYFIGKLGRKRVLSLYSEDVELPSDIHGLLYTQIDKAGNWKYEIVKELKAVGYNVDANKLL